MKVGNGRGRKGELDYLRKQEKDQARNKGKIPPQPDIKKESKCFFYKKKWHMKKDCSKFKSWFR